MLVAAGLAVSSGCAFGTRHAELVYPPRDHGGGAIAAVKADDTGNLACCDIVLAVSDLRTKTDRVGNVRNTLGMDTADVVTQDDVRAWVERAFAYELQRAGYTILPAGSAAGGGTPISLDAVVTKAHCDVYLTYGADIRMTVKISRQGAPAFERHYEGAGSVGLSWAATAKSYSESLALALQDAISQVLADLASYQRP